MIIHSRPRQRAFPRAFPGKGRAAWLAAYGLAALALGAWIPRFKTPAQEGASLFQRPFIRWAARWRARPDTLMLDVKLKHLQKLAFQRQDAMAYGVLLSGPEDFVPATVSRGGASAPAKIRLKGDWTDHFEGDRWSFRIRLEDGHALGGLREFSIQHPRTRAWLNEWLYHEALRREGVLAPRYEFLSVVLNGKDVGIYALEEHFRKELLEAQGRREGPILKFDEETLWADRKRHFPYFFRDSAGLQSLRAAAVDAFGSTRLLREPAAREQLLRAQDLLEGMRAGKIPPHRALDVELTARFLAISDLMGARHAGIWHNLRFYANPVTGLLEPIAFDGDAGILISKTWYAEQETGFEGLLFADPVLYGAYLKTLERISERPYLDGLFNSLQAALARQLHLLHGEFPEYQFNAQAYYRNQEVLRNAIDPAKAAHAYYSGVSGGLLELELANVQPMPLEALELLYEPPPKTASTAPRATAFPIERPVTLPPGGGSGPVEYRKAAFRLPANFPWEAGLAAGLRLRCRIQGASRSRLESVYPRPRPGSDAGLRRLRGGEPNFRSFAFVREDRKARRLLIAPGRWKLARDLVIGPGYRLLVAGGARLDLVQGASIVSRSPVEMVGEEGLPVVIESSDGTGQGLVVIQAAAPSTLRYARFDNLSAVSRPGWELTGAVTFYESPVSIAHCEFLRARAEDALNLIRSSFGVEKSSFRRTRSDALDVDFAQGEVSDSAFVEIGGDGLDFSGSVARVRGVTVSGAGDKGLSVGEMSKVEASGLTIAGAKVGIAAKDVSLVEVKGADIRGAEYGLSAYQKKPEFGAAVLTADKVTLAQVRTPYLVGPASRVLVDGKPIAPNHPSPAELLYPQPRSAP